MIPTEVLTEELLQQAAAELATALNDSLPSPTECQHKFSHTFEEKCAPSSMGWAQNVTQYQFRIL